MITYEDLGVKPVINACGRMTLLGATAIDEDVARAMVAASQHYVNMLELQERAGSKIAEITGAEAGCVTAGAASGIAMGAAAFIVGADVGRIQGLPESAGEKNKLLIQQGHMINFAAMAKMAGAELVPVGFVNFVTTDHLKSAISEKSAGFLFIISHHVVQKGMLSLEECIQICHEREIPVLVDAAAEEDITSYVAKGADLVTYSGGKALGGPSFGMICGKAKYVEACSAQFWGIARAMKVTKEGIMGFLTALENYASMDKEEEKARQDRILSAWAEALSNLPHTEVSIVKDEAGRDIHRLQLKINEDSLGRSAHDLINHLRSGDPAIVTRDHKSNLGIIALDPRPVTDEQVPVIVEKILSFY
jgi:L-seryl-tRNA(Ser) seleniumtransferase/D-glucosaminate-6-phosphate ammonia-lyase